MTLIEAMKMASEHGDVLSLEKCEDEKVWAATINRYAKYELVSFSVDGMSTPTPSCAALSSDAWRVLRMQEVK